MAISFGYSLVVRSQEEARERLPWLAEAGFKGVEPTFHPSGLPGPDNWRQTAGWLREECARLGLSLPSMRGGPLFWDTIPSPDPAARAKALDTARGALDSLAEMGGKLLLVVPGRAKPEIPGADHWQRVVDFARAAGDEAAARGLRLGLENVAAARFPDGLPLWEKLLAEINHPAVGMYLDVGNVVQLDAGNPAEWLESLAGRVWQIHFKDARRGTDLRYLLAGELEWPEIVAAIKKIGYSGWIFVEPEPDWYRHAPWRLPQRLYQDMQAILNL